MLLVVIPHQPCSFLNNASFLNICVKSVEMIKTGKGMFIGWNGEGGGGGVKGSRGRKEGETFRVDQERMQKSYVISNNAMCTSVVCGNDGYVSMFVLIFNYAN